MRRYLRGLSAQGEWMCDTEESIQKRDAEVAVYFGKEAGQTTENRVLVQELLPRWKRLKRIDEVCRTWRLYRVMQPGTGGKEPGNGRSHRKRKLKSLQENLFCCKGEDFQQGLFPGKPERLCFWPDIFRFSKRTAGGNPAIGWYDLSGLLSAQCCTVR